MMDTATKAHRGEMIQAVEVRGGNGAHSQGHLFPHTKPTYRAQSE